MLKFHFKHPSQQPDPGPVAREPIAVEAPKNGAASGVAAPPVVTDAANRPSRSTSPTPTGVLDGDETRGVTDTERDAALMPTSRATTTAERAPEGTVAATAEAIAPTDGIRLEAQHLETKLGHKTVVLHDVSLVAEPRELVAIVGVSGSGKTTLLGALSGVRRATSGSVRLNGHALYENFATLRTQIGYVPQDDIIHDRLTVERALNYSAQLRMPADTKRKARRARVSEVVEELGLQEQRTTLIANLSGGQRKRVNIAVELLTKPPLFFLDEPTSGLDPANEARMMDLLRQLTDQGRTLVLVTHATRTIALCNKVLFLAAGGRMAFFGTPDEALAYFGVADFEDIYVKLEGERSPEAWEAAYRASPYYRTEVTDRLPESVDGASEAVKPSDAARADEQAAVERVGLHRREPGAPRQFGILSRRYANSIVNDRKYLLVLLLQAPIIALLLWALFQPDVYTPPTDVSVLAIHDATAVIVHRDPRSGALVGVPPQSDLVAVQGAGCAQAGSRDSLPAGCHLAAGNGNNQALKAMQLAFILGAVAVWLGTLNAIREISKEDAIYRRERLINLRVLPYVASKLFVLSILVVLQSALLLGVAAAHIAFPMTVQHWLIQLPHSVGNVSMLRIPYPTGPIDGVFLSLVLGGIASVAVALAVSAAVSNPDRAMVAAPLIMVPQILFAGGLTPVQDLGPAQSLAALVATRWSHEAIGRVTGVLHVAALPENFPYAAGLRGEATSRWLILAGFVVIGSIFAVGLQRLKDRR